MGIMNMNFGYQLSIWSGAKENHRQPGPQDLPDAHSLPASSPGVKI